MANASSIDGTWPTGKALDIQALRSRDRVFANYLEELAEQPLDFRDKHPNRHSARNHQHLWLMEYTAERDASMDLAMRCAAVAFVLSRWRDRLVSYAPYQRDGYRLYLYEDLAPTLSVVAETPIGFPYEGCAQFTFVRDIADVLRRYVSVPWSTRFKGIGPTPDRVLKVVADEGGSLNRSARALSMPLAELRRTIETYDLAREVNDMRKHNGRRPAHFFNVDFRLPQTRIWEHRLPAGFRQG